MLKLEAIQLPAELRLYARFLNELADLRENLPPKMNGIMTAQERIDQVKAHAGGVSEVPPAPPSPTAPDAPLTSPEENNSNVSTSIDSAALDSSGLPWDARIHASTKGVIADGTWRRKKGVDEAEFERVKAELLAAKGNVPPAPMAPAAPAAPAADVPPAPTAPAAPAAPEAPAVSLQVVFGRLNGLKLPPERMQRVWDAVAPIAEALGKPAPTGPTAVLALKDDVEMLTVILDALNAEAAAQ